MSPDDTPDSAVRDRILQTRFRVAGVIILVAGLLAAVMINRRAASDDGGSDADILGDSKRHDYAMERIGGKSNELASEVREWFGGLWHGKRLAHTVVVLSVTGSLGCFVLAHLLTSPAPRDNQADHQND
jgi:hypothetical protein